MIDLLQGFVIDASARRVADLPGDRYRRTYNGLKSPDSFQIRLSGRKQRLFDTSDNVVLRLFVEIGMHRQ
jgi:hypothetical protein